MSRSAKDQGKLLSAWFPVVEALEGRRLLSASTIQTLPFLLDFNSQRGGLIDKDGEGIGFTRVQANKNGNEYQPNLIDLDTAAGVLRITTTGNATNGGNAGADNSLVNALETQFDGTTSGWAITARIIGPLSFLNDPFEQAGIYFGPDQDNFVKLVAIRQNDGNYLQFRDEQSTSAGGTTTSLPSSTDKINIGNFANINTLDVRLVGDGATGKVIAYYAVNGGAYVKVASELTLSGSKKTAFFNSASRAGLIQFHKNNVGPITVTYDSFSITGGQSLAGRPTVTATRPADGETNVSRDAFIAADVLLPTAGSGVDTDTLTPTSVKLYRTFDGLAIEGVINTSGGGDAIVFVPTMPLAANTQYTFEITDEVKDLSGASFVPYIARFTTGTQGGVVDSSVSFEQLPQQVTAGAKYTSVVVGPDKKLYATTIDGRIIRWNVNADGSLGSAQTINTLITKEGVERMAIGLVFDPASTSSNLIAYVTHSQYIFEGATDWTGKLTRLTGSNLQTATDVLIHLPRSVRDHMTNQMAFGPDGALYISQGSNSAMGAPDNAWGQRPERLLTGAILRVDLSKITTTLSVKTQDGGNYNPFAPNAPVTIYASGVRNAYDLLWHSNGRLYTAVNGSAANGAAPASPSNPYSNTRIDQHIFGDYTGPVVPGINPVQQTQNDFLLRIDQFGYYGHPNPLRYEWVLNGGNPTSGVDPAEVPQYPVGTLPDRNYRGFAWDFGKNYSPNGLVEFKGNAFNGALNGKILVVRYSGGDDIVVLDVDANGNITNAHTNYAGLTHFVDPLDITQDPNTGFLYVAEYGGERITLLRPVAAGAKIEVNKPTFYFNDVHSGATGGGGASPTQKLTIRNTGSSALTLASDAFSITGPNASQFFISGSTGLPRTVAPGESFDINLAFGATSYGIKTAILNIKSNDVSTPTLQVNLRGIGTNGTGGNLEPSLQRILDLYQIPVVVGDNNPDATAFPVPPQSPNDEVVMPRLLKAGAGPVTIELLGVFANNDVPGPKFGYYDPGTPGFKTELFSILQAHTQSVAAVPQGVTSFDPGSAAFALYSAFPKFAMREVYSEDHLNLWETNAANRRKVRFYPLKNSNGTIVPDAYVFAFEEWNVSFDQNDVIGIIRNVKAAPSGPEIGLENRDGVPFPDRLVFNRIRELDPDFPNEVKERATLRIRNTGSSTLSITSLVLSSSDWVIESGGSVSSISPGNFADITLRFVYNRTGFGNEIRNGTLTINSNDADEPATVVQLAGIWQSHSEDAPGRGTQEPTADTILKTLGYKVNLGTSLNTNGDIVKVGEEVISSYWKRADTAMPVHVRMLAAYHQQKPTTNSLIRWFYQGTTSMNMLFKHRAEDGQSLLPRIDGSTTNPAQASFTPNANAFGFRIDSHYSDPELNIPNTKGDNGHAMRWYIAKDRDGNIIPNTYILLHDYTGVSFANYDYQDNIYLVTNVKPVNPPSTPTGASGSGSQAGINLTWTKNTEGNVGGYRVYRSSSANGTFTLAHEGLITGTSFLDVNAPAGQTSFYRITAVDVHGGESGFATTSATRPASTGAPNAPSNLSAVAVSTSQVNLSWNDNSSNESGFRVLRKTGINGTYSVLFTTAPNATTYSDTSVVSGNTYYYRVEAFNASGPSAQSNEVFVNVGNVTPIYTSADIGNPTPAGSTTVVTAGRDYNVSGGGVDIWGTADQFRFVYTQLSGDFDMKVQVNSLDQLSSGAMAALMVRENLTAGSRNATLKLRESGFRFTSRSTANGTSAGQGSGAAAAPNAWLRMKREGNVFTGFGSTDGVTWTQIGQITLALPSNIYFGLAVSTLSNSQLATAQFRHLSNTAEASPTAPAAPSNLVATAAAHNRVNLTWTDNANNETGFIIERQTAGGAWISIATPGPDTTSYSDTTVAPSTGYSYRIRAVNAIGQSANSNTASASTPAAPVTATRTASADAYVRDGTSAGTNFGDSLWNEAKIGSSGNNRETYIRFDLDGLTTPVTSATLRLFARLTDANAPSVNFSAFAVDADWSEATLTWNNRPASTGGAVIAGAVAGTTASWYEFDVTNFIETARLAGKTSVTLVFRADATASPRIAFSSRETAEAPQLVLGSQPVQTIPNAPTNLGGSYASGQVNLIWTDNSSNESGFEIQRKIGAGGTWATLASVAADQGTYGDASVSLGTEYLYRVRAVNGAGNSNWSNEFTIATPAAPTNITINASADSYVRDGANADANFGSSLWNEAKIGSTGNNRETYISFDLSGLTSTVNTATLRLFARLTDTAAPTVPIAIFATDGAWNEGTLTWNNRPSTSGGAIVTGSINGNVAAWYEFNLTSFIEAARLAGKTSVTLVIRATASTSPRAAFSSLETAEKPHLVINTNGTTPEPPAPTPTAPATPSNLQAQLAAGQVDLTWADNSSNETGFEIQRKTGPDGTWATLTTVAANQTSYSDSSVASGTQYFYRVRAINDVGNSDWSNESQITTPAPSESITINASADAYVRDGTTAATNFGSSLWNEAKIGSTGNNRETYISFDLSGLTSTVNSATLRLFARLTDTAAPSVPIAIFSTDGAWSESTLTWNNRPGTSGGAIVTGSINGNVAAWYEFNLTSFIEAARLAGKTSVTLVIRATASTSPRAAFSSLETAEKPHLVINGNGTSETPMAALSSTVIGSPSPTGGTTVITDGSDYDITSGAGDIWGNADSFRFVHTSVSGDFDIAVRVAGLDASDPNAHAALMARDTLDDNSRNITIKAREGSYRFTYRANTGGSTVGAGAAETSYPNTWLRLVRTGNTFTSYISTDGITWQLFASQTQSMPQTLYVGLAVAGIDGTATAQFRDLTIA